MDALNVAILVAAVLVLLWLLPSSARGCLVARSAPWAALLGGCYLVGTLLSGAPEQCAALGGAEYEVLDVDAEYGEASVEGFSDSATKADVQLEAEGLGEGFSDSATKADVLEAELEAEGLGEGFSDSATEADVLEVELEAGDASGPRGYGLPDGAA